MIPEAEEVVAGFRFAARRWGLSGEPSPRAVEAGREDAVRLAAGDAAAEPAALFFAFARRPRAFPGAWRLMPALLAINQARSLRFRMRADRDEMNRLLTGIATRELSFDDVRTWFERRLERIE